MTTRIGPLAVRRSIWIDATPARIWQEFENLERMQRWYGTGHTLVSYEPVVGAEVETNAGDFRFVGPVRVVDPPHELTFEQDWIGRGWKAPSLITLRITPLDGGSLVELFHHGFEAFGADAGESHAGFEEGWTMRQLLALRDVVAP